MNLGLAAALALAGYLVGAISFARIVGRRIAPDEDLSKNTLNLPGDATIEYGGVSATSIAIRGGPKWGSFTGLLDMAKAFVPTLVVRLIWPDESYHLVVAVATIVGHNYPVYHRFKGGRGQTPIYGSLLAIDWIAVPITDRCRDRRRGGSAQGHVHRLHHGHVAAHPLVCRGGRDHPRLRMR